MKAATQTPRGPVLEAPLSPVEEQRGARALAAGEAMAYPTETFYALGGNALDKGLVERVYRLKGRAGAKALPLLVDPRAGWERWVRPPGPEAERLMAAFWPGPLTLVLRAGPGLPVHLQDQRGTVALRWSPHPVVARLLELGGAPLIGTSANRTGEPPATTAAAVRATFGAGVALVIDGGTAPGGAPSTLLDLTVRPFRLVREGPVKAPALRKVLGDAPLATSPR